MVGSNYAKQEDRKAWLDGLLKNVEDMHIDMKAANEKE